MQNPVGAVVVLAAGGGTRMKSRTSKLLHPVAGRPMVGHALKAAREVHPERLVVVVGHLREQVEAYLNQLEAVETVVQPTRNGTGGAVQCAMEVLADVEGEIVVTYGDVPLLSAETLQAMVDVHRAEGNACTLLTAELPNPAGYGRIIREDGQIVAIVEDKDCTDEQRAVREINSGLYVFNAATLREGLATLTPNNAQGELYLTDVIGYARSQGGRLGSHITTDLWQTEGVNDRVQLARMNAEANRRICEHWMREGVSIVDPATTWIDDTVTLASDVTLLPGVQLQGACTVATGAVIGPDCTLKDCEVGEDATISRTHGELAIIGAGAEVGPFSRLRPGTVLGEKGKIGSFVETKNAQIGRGSKVPHLTYCGDAVLGEGVNVGAGTIFANYDGKHKSPTHLGDHVFIGSNSVLVAPLDIADGAFVAAGSAIVGDVPAGALAVARGRAHIAEGWVARKRPGSKASDAASNSSDEVHPTIVEARARLSQEEQ